MSKNVVRILGKPPRAQKTKTRDFWRISEKVEETRVFAIFALRTPRSTEENRELRRTEENRGEHWGEHWGEHRGEHRGAPRRTEENRGGEHRGEHREPRRTEENRGEPRRGSKNPPKKTQILLPAQFLQKLENFRENSPFLVRGCLLDILRFLPPPPKKKKTSCCKLGGPSRSHWGLYQNCLVLTVVNDLH